MTIYAYGQGITQCGFCSGIVRYRIDGRSFSILGRPNWVMEDALMPLYCSDACEAASRNRLGDKVTS